MLKLFRHIRQRLLQGNSSGQNSRATRLSKYLVYAVGEIILIVIGILIAFSINNWNTNKKERIKETAILKQLQTEFQSNLEQLDNKIAIRNDIINASIKLLGYIDNPDHRITDSINAYIWKTTAYPTFDPIVNDLASSGNLRLIVNDSLKQRLSNWTSELVQVKEEENFWVKYSHELYLPFIIKHYPFRTMVNDDLKSVFNRKSGIGGTLETRRTLDSIIYYKYELGDSKYEMDPNIIFNQPDFEGHLTECFRASLGINRQSYTLRKRILDILDILDREIEKKQRSTTTY